GLLRKTCGVAAALRYAASSPSRYLKRGIRQMKSLKLLAIGGSMALLGACTNLQQFQATAPGAGGTEFTRALAQQYRTFSADEWNSRTDFSTSEWFAAKGLRVNAGEALPPEELGTWGPWAELANDLAEARARLVFSLN